MMQHLQGLPDYHIKALSPESVTRQAGCECLLLLLFFIQNVTSGSCPSRPLKTSQCHQDDCLLCVCPGVCSWSTFHYRDFRSLG